MARRRRTPVEATAPSSEAEDAARVAAEEEQAQKHQAVVSAVEALVARDVPRTQIYRTLRLEHGIGITSAKTMVEEIESSMVARFLRRSRTQNVAAALVRAYSYMRRAEGAGKLELALRIEHLIKDLEGTKAAERVEVSHILKDAYSLVFAGMDADEFQEFAAEGVEMSRLAEIARTSGLAH